MKKRQSCNSRSLLPHIPTLHRLDSRIILLVQLGWDVGIPGSTRVFEIGECGIGVEDFRLGLDELESEALRGVPGDMAVHEPRAGVVDAESDGEVAVSGEGGNIATRGVAEVEDCR